MSLRSSTIMISVPLNCVDTVSMYTVRACFYVFTINYNKIVNKQSIFWTFSPPTIFSVSAINNMWQRGNKEKCVILWQNGEEVINMEINCDIIYGQAKTKNELEFGFSGRSNIIRSFLISVFLIKWGFYCIISVLRVHKNRKYW